MRDLHPRYWIGLPVGSFALCVLIAIVNTSFYRQYVRLHEVGALEHGTVICLIPAVAMGVMVFRRRRELPAPWLGWWTLLITVGAFYFAGEECSWGQNYMGWATPESWGKINDQNETNLHNTSNLLDHLPRNLLNLAAIAAIVSHFMLARRRQQWDPQTNPWQWFWPTKVVVPTAIIAILVGIPQKFHGSYVKGDELTRSWFSDMFYAGRHSELKEYLLAMFILMYLWSMAVRIRTMSRGDRAVPEGQSRTVATELSLRGAA